MMLYKRVFFFGLFWAASSAGANQVVLTAQISNISFYDFVNQTSTLVPGTRTLSFSFDPSAITSTFQSVTENLAIGYGSKIDSPFSSNVPFQIPPFESFWYTVVANYSGADTLNKSVTIKNRGTSSGSNGEIRGYQTFLTGIENESSNGKPRYFMTDPAEILSYFTSANASFLFQESYYIASPNAGGGYSYPVNGMWTSSDITVTMQAVPEPATTVMFTLGLLGFLSQSKRKRAPLAG